MATGPPGSPDEAAHELELARVFAEIARTLLAEEDLAATLVKICTLAVKTIGGCDHAGITLVQGRNVSTEGASDEVPELVDAIQYQTGEGPCLNAISAHEVFLTDDLAEEARWPKFATRAVEETGVHSMLSLRLFADGDTMGALNLYSKATAAFDDEAREVGSVFAAHAAVAMASAKDHEHMQEAVRSRDVIGQAKGILMARQDITEGEAFDLLRRASQRLNIKLRDVAQAVSEGKPAAGPAGPGNDALGV